MVLIPAYKNLMSYYELKVFHLLEVLMSCLPSHLWKLALQQCLLKLEVNNQVPMPTLSKCQPKKYFSFQIVESSYTAIQEFPFSRIERTHWIIYRLDVYFIDIIIKQLPQLSKKKIKISARIKNEFILPPLQGCIWLTMLNCGSLWKQIFQYHLFLCLQKNP